MIGHLHFGLTGVSVDPTGESLLEAINLALLKEGVILGKAQLLKHIHLPSPCASLMQTNAAHLMWGDIYDRLPTDHDVENVANTYFKASDVFRRARLVPEFHTAAAAAVVQ